MVTVEDNVAPMVVTKDITVWLDANGAASIIPTDVDNNSSDNCGIESYSLDITDFGCENIGENTVTLTVTDVNGNAASETAVVFLKDTLAPIVSASPITVYLMENGEYVLNKKDIVSASFGNNENGFTRDNCTSYDQLKIEIFPRSFECIHVGAPVLVKIYATDQSGNTGIGETTVLVLDTIAPAAKCKNSIIYLDGNGKANVFPGEIMDSENQFNNPDWARSYNNNGNTNFDACGVDILSLDKQFFSCEDLGDNTVTLTVTDPSGNSSVCNAVVSVLDTIQPRINPVQDIDLFVEPGVCETSFDYPEITAQDNCVFTTELIDGLGPDGKFPLGATTETWRVTDAAENISILSFTVNVNTTNAAPKVDSINDLVVDEDNPEIIIPINGISYGNDCSVQKVSVSAENDNPDLIRSLEVIYDEGSTTATLHIEIAPDKSDSAEITIVVNDSENASVSQSFKLTVLPVNDAPYVINPVPDQMIYASNSVKIPVNSVSEIIFGDVDDDILSIGIAGADSEKIPDWMALIGDTIYCNPTMSDTGSVDIVLIATDAAGAFVTDTFNVWVEGIPVNARDIRTAGYEPKMYPNPTRGIVTVDLNNTIEKLELTVLDISGREVIKRNFTSAKQFNFDMSGHVSGIYLVKLKFDETVVLKKLIYERK